MRIIIIEDDPNDLQTASRLARTVGFEHVEAFTSTDGAMERIEQGLKGEMPRPDAIILDLSLGYDSGFEVLRRWRTSWTNSQIQLIVWSMLEEHNRKLCDLFHPSKYVPKWEGDEALSQALREAADAG